MKNWKRATRRSICALLIAAMLCSDAGLTAYAAEGAEQEMVTEVLEKTLAEEPQKEEVRNKEALEEEIPAVENVPAEETPAEEAPAQEAPSEDSQPGEVLAEDGQTERNDSNAEAGTEEKPAEEDAAPEGNSDGEKEENTGDASVEESVSENDIEDMEESLETSVKAVEDNSIASGVYKEDGNDITWVIDADGKLTVEGTGEFASSTNYSYNRAPWFEYRYEVKSAEVKRV